MRLKTKKLPAMVARRIIASILAGGLVACTGTLAFAADANGNSKTVTKDNYEGGDIYAGYSNDGDKSNNNLTASNVEVSSA